MTDQRCIMVFGSKWMGCQNPGSLDWDEVLSHDMSPRKYTVTNIFRRLGFKSDPWAKIDKSAVNADSLKNAVKPAEK